VADAPNLCPLSTKEDSGAWGRLPSPSGFLAYSMRAPTFTGVKWCPVSASHKSATLSRTQEGTSGETVVEIWWTVLVAEGGAESFGRVCKKTVPHGARKRLEEEARWLHRCRSLGTATVRLMALVTEPETSHLFTEYLLAGDVFGWKASNFRHGASIWIRSGLVALRHMHAMDIAHNDISAENLSCRQESGQCVFLDFEDASRASDPVPAQRLRGKPRYCAPERPKEKLVDVRLCDLFAFGVVCAMVLLPRAKENLLWAQTRDIQNQLPSRIARVMNVVGAAAADAPAEVVPLLALEPRHRSRARSYAQPRLQRQS